MAGNRQRKQTEKAIKKQFDLRKVGKKNKTKSNVKFSRVMAAILCPNLLSEHVVPGGQARAG